MYALALRILPEDGTQLVKMGTPPRSFCAPSCQLRKLMWNPQRATPSPRSLLAHPAAGPEAQLRTTVSTAARTTAPRGEAKGCMGPIGATPV